jgi:hypothetical protein
VDQQLVRYRSFISDSARWEGFVFRPDDIVINAPPKCGTTWTQMICALLIFQTPTFPMPLDLMSPWLDMLTQSRDEVVAELEAQTHRRFIKTHTPMDGLPFDERVTYVCVGRDPRDVALSWDNHMANMDIAAMLRARGSAVGNEDLAEFFPEGPPTRPEREIDRFWAWVDEETTVTASAGLKGALHHLSTFWVVRDRPNVVLLHYDDLKIAPEVSKSLWQSNEQFFNRGTSGQWRRLLDDDGSRRYSARAALLAEPDVVAWAHRTHAGAPN